MSTRTATNPEIINFLSNERLEQRLKSTTATPEQVTEVIRINEEARLGALKIAFFALGSLALLAIFRCGRLPNYKPGEVPADLPPRSRKIKAS